MEVTPETAATPSEEQLPKKAKTKGTKKKRKVPSKGRTDEELFGNHDDIFGGLPEPKAKSPKVKKKKKKAESMAVGGEGEGEGGAVGEERGRERGREGGREGGRGGGGEGGKRKRSEDG